VDLYLVRHGETESNRERKYTGWTESPLSEQGILQAERAAQYLADKNIDALYCSDLDRALQTARIIGSASGLQPRVTSKLREIHFGRWEGMTFNEIQASWGDRINHWLDDPFRRSAPEGETLEKVCRRMQTFLDTVSRSYPDGNRVVAVSHGGSIRALLSHVMGLDPKKFWDLKIDNASVSLVKFDGFQHKLIYYNKTAHLTPDGC
jgi:alpha-ribazole phosphatase